MPTTVFANILKHSLLHIYPLQNVKLSSPRTFGEARFGHSVGQKYKIPVKLFDCPALRITLANMLTCTSAMADVCPVRSGFIPIERSPPMAKTAMLDNDQSITLMNTIDVYHTMINISCSCDRYVIHDISIYFSICLKYIYIYIHIQMSTVS